MNETYDVYVDYDTLCTIEDKLQKITYDLTESARKMVEAIQNSQEFLAGNQFEKAKAITSKSKEIAQKASINVKHAQDYIVALKNVLEAYNSCRYTEEDK